MFQQTDRPLNLTTPLGKDALLPTALRGREAISELFRFEIDTVWEDKNKLLPFDQLLGQKVTAEIDLESGKRYFNGIVVKITQQERDMEFTHYVLEVVPQLWLLTRKYQSRIFQHLTVPDILKQVITGLTVSYETQGQFKPREYCVQYRETDFAFVSRLMEEEGIYYFFKHSEDDHKLVLADTPQSHPAVPFQTTVTYEEISGHTRDDERVSHWFKAQEIRSGKYTTWDEHFQMPGKHLDAQKGILDTVQVGKTTHKLKVAGNDSLELYEFPGDYSRRFDGIDKGGGTQSTLNDIFTDNTRTVEIRMQQEALPSLLISGQSGHPGFTAGHTFDLDGHFSDNGKFVLTGVDHDVRQPMPTGQNRNDNPFQYDNRFECIPFALPFRPQRITPTPSVQGVQLATVTGPSGEEIFTDKYGRVKVQFHWDRGGSMDANSSCWLRVGTHWAGKQWGAIHIPRIGQEVIVDFEEGDVDHPIIIGSVYNADMMPPYTLPDNKTQSGIRSRSSKDASNDMLNEIRFEDKKDSEHIYIQAQKDMHLRVKNDRMEYICHDTHLTVDNDRFKQIKRDEHIEVKRDRMEEIDRDLHVTIAGKSATAITKTYSLKVDDDVSEKFQKNHSEECGSELYLKAGTNITIEGGVAINLKAGGSFISIGPSGVTISGAMVLINSGGSAGSGSLIPIVPPTAPQLAVLPITTKPTGASSPSGSGSGGSGGGAGGGGGGGSSSPAGPTHDPAADENKDKTHWVAIQLVDESGQPLPGEAFEIKLPDGSYYTGTTDEKGQGRVDHIDPGSVDISFPNLDKEAWEPG